MKFSPIVLFLVACTIGVYCDYLGSPYYYFYPVKPKTGNNIGWYFMIFLFLALLFPNLFGSFGTGLRNLVTGGNGGGGGGNNSYPDGGGNTPPLMIG